MAKNEVRLMATAELKERLMTIAPEKRQPEILAILLDAYEQGYLQNLSETKQKHFGYVTEKILKEKPYMKELVEVELSPKELIQRAIDVSGKSKQEFLESALLTQAKAELAYAAKQAAPKKADPRDEKLRLALSQYNQEIAQGDRKMKGEKPGIFIIAKLAKVNGDYAKKWQENNPLLFVAQELETEVGTD